MIMIKLRNIINFIQSPWLKILYKKYINPLKDVKQEKKPLNKIFSFDKLIFLLIIKPTKNDPIIEIIKLFSIDNLRKDPSIEIIKLLSIDNLKKVPT